MCDEQIDLAYYLHKAADYRKKAKAVSDQRLKAALEAMAREYMGKARKLDPSLSSDGGNWVTDVGVTALFTRGSVSGAIDWENAGSGRFVANALRVAVEATSIDRQLSCSLV
jgi:hypothetical protein